MTHKILVPTDFSSASRAGLRFAIQLAGQQQSKLIFYHVMHAAMPTSWSRKQYTRYIEEQVKDAEVRLKSFVARIYRQMGLTVRKPECVVEFKPFVDLAIINYAVKKTASLICMSTRGAGAVKRLFGTNTSSILSKSPVPVLAVPDNYRRSRLTRILYASDLTALPTELKLVKRFADASKCKLSVIHYNDLLQASASKKSDLEKVANKFRALGMQFHQKKYNWEQSMSEQIRSSVKQLRPSVLAVFTRQDKDLLEKIFPQSNSEKLSFNATKPLLVFPKR